MTSTCTITLEDSTTEIVEVNFLIVGNEDIEVIRELDFIDKLDWFQIISISSANANVQAQIKKDLFEYKLEVIEQL